MSETAIVFELRELEPIVDKWRLRHTADGARGMPPHITLLYPFADTSELDDAARQAVADTVAPHPTFELQLREARYFHGDENWLYLAPEPAEPIVAVIASLADRFPDHPPYGGRHLEVIPHATVAQGTRELLAGIEAELRGSLPVTLAIREVALYVDTPGGWRAQETFPLNRHSSD